MMLLNMKQTMISALFLAAVGTATPSPKVPAGLVVLEQVAVENGTLTWSVPPLKWAKKRIKLTT